MAADPEMWKAFLGHLQAMIDERRKEVAPFENGTMTVGRKYQGEWVDITQERVAQINREIASLENTYAEYAPYAKGT